MGSIKSFLDWVKGGDAEDDYEEDMSRQPRSEEPAISAACSKRSGLTRTTASLLVVLMLTTLLSRRRLKLQII